MSQVLSRSEMREVSLEELGNLVKDSFDSIWSQARSCGREPKIYLHWTAGRYHQFWDSYHVQIDYDGKIYVPADISMDTVLSSTYMRNTGSISVTVLGCYDATTEDLGSEPPTNEQIEMMAQVIAVVADALWLTINKTNVLTHGEAAANEDEIYPHAAYALWNDEEGDGNVRWDLEYLGTDESPCYNPYATDGSRGGDVLRGKANWYRNLWAGK